MRLPFLLLVLMILMACGGKDAPQAPAAAQLTFPLKNSECTTGETVIGTNTSVVTFNWVASNHTETYELRATNLNTNTTQTIMSTAPTAKLTLEKGSPYSWSVISRNKAVQETGKSETWLFYNAGFQTTYAPFPAEVKAPRMGSTVAKDINNEVVLIWEGADVDNDLAGYEVYFSTDNPPTTLLASLTSSQSELNVSVTSNTSYYWRIVSFDLEGNKATNAIASFKVR